jgi:phosphatidylinositol 4-kinase B
MQIRLQRTKQDWTNRLHQQQAQQIGANGSSATSSVSPFRVLLQLFAYEDVLENRKLDAVFDADDGVALTFYVPQLLSFLLHGALYSSPALEEWILNKCKRNIYFAHRCYWYLRAWCLEVPAESRPITPSLSRRNSASNLSSNNLTNGAIGVILSQQQQSQATEGLLPFLDEPAVSEKKQAQGSSSKNLRNSCLPGSGSGGGATSGGTSSANIHSDMRSSVVSPTSEKDKFLIPEERAMIERFMMRVKECGQIPAYALEFGGTVIVIKGFNGSPLDRTKLGTSTYESVESPDRNKNSLTFRGGGSSTNGSTPIISNGRSSRFPCIAPDDVLVDDASESSVHTAVIKALLESGKVPMDPSTGNPSVSHVNALLVHQQTTANGFRLPQQESSILGSNDIKMTPPRHSETEQFDKTPQFLDALIFLAENLYHIPRENRRDTLRQQLQSLECELLPCNSIYLPVGSMNRSHRVWRIVAEESIAISTKERVPCIVALEVIDFMVSTDVAKKFSDDRRSVEASVMDVVGINGHINHAVPSSVQNGPSDSDVVSVWRYGYRNPLRHVPFLDKVTTSVKVPFAKMKTQVRDHFNHLRDRGVSEEMQALSSADALAESHFLAYPNQDQVLTVVVDGRAGSDDGAVPFVSTIHHDQILSLTDPETGISRVNDEPIRSLSRMNSGGSIISLGQWSSPTTLPRSVSDSEKRTQLNLNEVRMCLDNDSSERHRRSSPLLYGSDQEDDPSDRGSAALSRRPPSGRRSFSNATTMTKEFTSKESGAFTSRPPPVVFRESWVAKQERVRHKSAFGDHPGWKLVAILIKGNDDLRQEQLAAQLIQRMATILACERVNVWLCPYEIIATTDRGGIIEAIPDTISIDSLKKNDPNYTTLNDFFLSHYGENTEELAGAKANFVESLAAYSMVCFILQLKDRHNGNILLDKWGHIIHIDFGFFFLSSPGKNAGFESAPFKLTREFVELLEGTNSHLFRTFRDLCFKTFIALRRRCMEIILLVEMLKNGNEDLKCFRSRPEDAIQQLRDRFRLDLNDRACKEYVNCLIDDSIENWRTDWYDRYQRYCVGVF